MAVRSHRSGIWGGATGSSLDSVGSCPDTHCGRCGTAAPLHSSSRSQCGQRTCLSLSFVFLLHTANSVSKFSLIFFCLWWLQLSHSILPHQFVLHTHTTQWSTHRCCFGTSGQGSTLAFILGLLSLLFPVIFSAGSRSCGVSVYPSSFPFFRRILSAFL